MRMSTRQKILALSLGLVLLTVFWMPSSGKAQGIIFGDRIQSGQVIDKNILMNGTDVVIDGTINGDLIAFGRTITVDGQINGTLLAVGETITINGQVSGNLIAGAVRMEVGSEGKVERDLYFAGARLSLPEGSIVQRDLFLLGLEAQLSGRIDRDIHAIIGPLQIAQLIFGPIKERITIIGDVQQVTNVQNKVPKLANLGAGVLVPASFWWTSTYSMAQQVGQIDTDRLAKWGVALIRNLIALLVVGMVSIWLVPGPLYMASEKIHQSPWWMAFSGMTIFLGGWFVGLLAITLILTLALFFYSVSLPNLGFLLGALGLLGVGLGATVFWLAIIYVSKLLVAILVGRLLLQRFGPQYAQGNLWPLLLGVVLYALVASIPYLGWVVASVVTFIGLGALGVVAFPSLSRQQDSGSLPALAQSD